ncbi:hypothetical protein VVD49_00785 [Uliginosibacterium sp. H3]|uniref:Uncharacterized protein n=1 Tax=Uliginosibacterium silvisoli TaxID=3114758 RepID=A0ABU6JYK4_9RHOO|nr:hypothetical protein [Uliginosibacterium sp. H3]
MAETLTPPAKAKAKKPDATATTNTTPGSCVDVPCVVKHKVTYHFDITSKKTLLLPYAYAINGKVDTAFRKGALYLSCGDKAGFSIYAEKGAKIEFYLGSDAHPDFRKAPVYAFTVGDAAAEIQIKEKAGKHSDTADLVFKETKETKASATGSISKVHHYAGTLTGDIWLKISHRYFVDEATDRIPASVSVEIRTAVLKLYSQTSPHSGDLKITLQKADKAAQSVTLKFVGSDNCSNNINNFDLYADGLPRVHPQAWVAVIETALEANVSEVTISSGWRPMIGSILHRVGLGLDVNYLDKTRLNRKELRAEQYGKGTSPDTSNVSEEEKRLFDEKLKAEAAEKQAKANLQKLLDEQKALEKARKTSLGKIDPLREAALPGEIEAADKAAASSSQKVKDANTKWGEERDKNEPASVKSFRTRLMKCDCVRSVFDPWFMDVNTKDKINPTPNVQHDSNETLHADHLHLTVRDEGLPLP